MAKVSVIIPVYNVEKYLRECLDSVVNQTLKDIEIICINDGSTDGSLEILKEYAQKDNRVIVIDRENRGVSKSRNEGIEKASGEFVCFMDPDDFYPEMDILETLYNKAIENNVLICGGEFSHYKADENKITQNYSESFYGYLFKKNGLIEYIDYQFDYGFTRFIYHKKLLTENGIRFPEYKTFEDPPFFVTAMIKAKQFFAVNKISYTYRTLHKQNKWTKSKIKDLLKGLIDNIELAQNNNLSKLSQNTSIRFKQNYSQIEKNIDLDILEQIEILQKYNSEIEEFCKQNKLTKKNYYTRFLQRILSIKNEQSRDKKYKVITLLGIKLKFRRKDNA